MADICICLDELLEQRNMTRYALAKATGIQYQTIDKYYKNRVKRFDSFVLERICAALDCDVSDILKFVKE